MTENLPDESIQNRPQGDPPDNDIPKMWKVERYELTGNFKLAAQFNCPELNAKVKVRPMKTYEQPGFPDAHRITLETPEDGLEVISEGLSVEHPEEALQVANEEMQRE